MSVKSAHFEDNLLLDALFFWCSLHVGDEIIIDADLHRDNQLLLKGGQAYQVLAKVEYDTSHIAFVVQSDITQRLVSIHPFLVSDYQISTRKQPHWLN